MIYLQIDVDFYSYIQKLNLLDIINYSRSSLNRNCPICVMCGKDDVSIPVQNKDVCKTCDSAFWLVQGFVVKFCKGCKNFTSLAGFDDKPEASKCSRCRKRGRQNYFQVGPLQYFTLTLPM